VDFSLQKKQQRKIEIIQKSSEKIISGKSQFLIGKPSINGPFSMAMLNNQMVSAEVSSLRLPSAPFGSLRSPKVPQGPDPGFSSGQLGEPVLLGMPPKKRGTLNVKQRKRTKGKTIYQDTRTMCLKCCAKP
jgi:hypothetical protein